MPIELLQGEPSICIYKGTNMTSLEEKVKIVVVHGTTG